jgi:hypothetical protein
MDINDLTKNIKKEITYIDRGVINSDESVGKIQNMKTFLMRRTIRPIFSVAVNRVHSGMKGRYDKFVFIYSDPRLLFLSRFAKDFIKDNIDNSSDIDMFNKIIDISLGIMKEDIYYRVRVFELINKFMEENVKFVLTDEEKKV